MNKLGTQPKSAPLAAPAAERNRGPILEVLRRVLPSEGLVLEIASGAGQHVAHFAAALPALTWQPSELDLRLLGSIRAHVAAAELTNVAEPLELDVERTPWPLAHADALLSSNLIHIAPWSATVALFAGAAEILESVGAPVILYGPFQRYGRHTAPSNAAFDASLKARHADWGVRDLEAVTELARGEGFELDEVIAMPANNLTAIYRRAAVAQHDR